MPMFGQIRPEFQCLDNEDQNSNDWTDKARVPMFAQIRSEF